MSAVPAMATVDEPRAYDDAEMRMAVLAPLRSTPRWWWVAFAISAAGALLWTIAVVRTVAVGIGTWGNNIPVAWAFAIVNFVWWIGIGHAGTFISAFLLLLNQSWRAAISRMAEAMTLIAVAIAGTFPLLHLGRPWFFYWLIPYPATTDVWPNFKSALPWDVVAVGSYFTVSAVFFYLGVVPDVALVRDSVGGQRRRRAYGIFALGWSGAGSQWRRRRTALKIIAGVVAALVVSVHSIVSLDFSIAQLAGWHSTIFPPYFVTGAIYSGFAMVIVLAVTIRRIYSLESVITLDHCDRLAQFLLTIGLLLTYCYVTEFLVARNGDDPLIRSTQLVHWPFGTFGWIYWLMMALNVGTPHVFWSGRMRRNPGVLLAAGFAVLVGMWLERFVIIVSSLAQSALPSSWFDYVPTWVDWSILGGSLAIFALVFLLFLRFVPAVAVDELRHVRFIRETGERR